MARTSIKINATDFAVIDSDLPNTHQQVTIPGPNELHSDYLGKGKWFLFKFENRSSTLGTKRLYEIKAVFRVGAKTATSSYINALAESYDENTVTWNTRPSESYSGASLIGGGTRLSDTDDTFDVYGGDAKKSQAAYYFLKSCCGMFQPTQKSYAFRLYTTLTNSTPAYVEIFYDDTETVKSQIAYQSGPTSGYKNPNTATTFEWKYEKTGDYYCATEFSQVSASFFWKTASSDSYTEVAIQGNTKRVDISAGTFPTREQIQWYVEGTDADGTTSSTDVFSFSTTDAYISTTPLRPINSVEDGSSPITLSWTYTSPNGTTPTSYVIRYKGENDSEFTQLTYQQGSATTYIVPANTFPSGEVEWYVMMYNIDTYGHPDYCTHAKFINYAAPTAPVLSVEAVPFTRLNWQSASQEAYEIQADGKTYGPYFGTEKTFELPEYLEDGQHTVKVRVLGGFNLWSNWTPATVNINNVPGSAITLSAQSHIDTELSWETESETPDYLIFRDGKQIARTNKTAFTDRFVTGEHSYYIINKLSDGNYTKSNEIDAGAILDTMYISLVNGGAWTKIRYNLADQSDAGYEDSIDSTYNHLAGDVYPSATLGTYRESNVSLSAVFLYTEEEERKQFEALFGKLVIIKFKDGNVLFGVLDSWSKQARKHYWTGYTFTIRRVEWEDFVDDTD